MKTAESLAPIERPSTSELHVALSVVHVILSKHLTNQPTDRIVHTMTFGIPVMQHWLEREIAQ